MKKRKTKEEKECENEKKTEKGEDVNIGLIEEK